MRFQPTQRHALALAAAIAEPEVARDAYIEWSSDGHEPDVEERRLLAMMAANLSTVLPDNAVLAEIRVGRLRTIAHHVRRIANCKQVADALTAAGIDNLFFKGVGMLPWYPDPSLRTMFDADVLVPWHLRHEAINLFAARGFKPVYRRDLDEVHLLTTSYPGWGMQQSDGTEIDLHWRPLHHLRQRPHVDATLFSSARVATISSVALPVPDPSHHLVLVAAHGMRGSSEAHLISLVDAIQLLRSPDFDAVRAADLAREYERTSAVIDTCRVLTQLGLAADLAGPMNALREQLHRRTVSDRLIGLAASAPIGPAATRAQTISDVWTAVSTTTLRKGGPVVGVLDVVRRRLGVRQLRDIPGQALWLATGRPARLERFRADRGTPPERRLQLSIGDQVEVGKLDSLSRLLPTGWWEEEGHFVWSRGRESVIDFDLDLGNAGNASIVLFVSPWVGEEGVLTVDLRVNRRPHAAWEYVTGTPSTYTHEIPITAAELDNGRCQIMLLIDGASSPATTGQSRDARELGLSLISLRIEPVVAQTDSD